MHASLPTYFVSFSHDSLRRIWSLSCLALKYRKQSSSDHTRIENICSRFVRIFGRKFPRKSNCWESVCTYSAEIYDGIKINMQEKGFSFSDVKRSRVQGCQIILGTYYLNRKTMYQMNTKCTKYVVIKYPKSPQNFPNGHKIYKHFPI
jgi:hypothetical protein